jgi:uncharacterized protein YegL
MKGEILAILDRSGSMSDCTDGTIQGYNRFLEAQKEKTRDWRDIRLTTVLFDDRYETLCRHIPLCDVERLTARAYFVRGSTALYDAIGRTIRQARERIEDLPQDERPARVVVLLITDGMENASVQYSSDEVKRLIENRRNAGWEFFFLGAELESFADAERIGIASNRRCRVSKSDMPANFCAMSDNIATYLRTGSVDEDWDEKLT